MTTELINLTTQIIVLADQGVFLDLVLFGCSRVVVDDIGVEEEKRGAKSRVGSRERRSAFRFDELRKQGCGAALIAV